MKTLFSSFVAAVVAALIITGCGSVPKTAYKTAAAADMTVSAAYIVFSDLVAAGRVPTDTVELANKALATYKSAEMALIDAGEAYQKNGDKSSVEKAIAALAAASGDFIAIVQQYTPKAKQ